jgi:hypothetical protein
VRQPHPLPVEAAFDHTTVDRYETVPGNISKKVQEEAAKHRTAETEE